GLLLGMGDGTFHAAHDVPAGAAHPTSIAVADLNRDGRADLIEASAIGSDVSVELGHGDGTFGSPTSFAVGAWPAALATANFTVGHGSFSARWQRRTSTATVSAIWLSPTPNTRVSSTCFSATATARSGNAPGITPQGTSRGHLAASRWPISTTTGGLTWSSR